MSRFLASLAMTLGLFLAPAVMAAESPSLEDSAIGSQGETRRTVWRSIVLGDGLGRPVGETGGMPDPIG